MAFIVLLVLDHALHIGHWSVTGAAYPTCAALSRSVGINAHRQAWCRRGEIIHHAQPEQGGLPGAPLAQADRINGF